MLGYARADGMAHSHCSMAEHVICSHVEAVNLIGATDVAEEIHIRQ